MSSTNAPAIAANFTLDIRIVGVNSCLASQVGYRFYIPPSDVSVMINVFRPRLLSGNCC